MSPRVDSADFPYVIRLATDPKSVGGAQVEGGSEASALIAAIRREFDNISPGAVKTEVERLGDRPLRLATLAPDLPPNVLNALRAAAVSMLAELDQRVREDLGPRSPTIVDHARVLLASVCTAVDNEPRRAPGAKARAAKRNPIDRELDAYVVRTGKPTVGKPGAAAKPGSVADVIKPK